MLLVDSSVWIDWLRGADTDAVRFIQQREAAEEIALTQMIYLEVLQGVNSDRQLEAVRKILGAQTVLEPGDRIETFEAAAALYRRARRQGLTIRKSTDCLIAAIALEQGAVLVHNDRDFLALGRVAPQLVLFPAGAGQSSTAPATPASCSAKSRSPCRCGCSTCRARATQSRPRPGRRAQWRWAANVG